MEKLILEERKAIKKTFFLGLKVLAEALGLEKSDIGFMRRWQSF